VRAGAGGGLGLALLGMLPGDDGRSRAYVSLTDGAATITRSFSFGDEDLTRRWVYVRAVDMVRRHLLGLPPFDR